MKNTSKTPARLSCLTMDPKECYHRVSIAEEKTWSKSAVALGFPADTTDIEQMSKISAKDNFYGSEVLWHNKFAAAFVESMEGLSISSMTGYLDCEYVDNEKRGRLDRCDFAYMADILREALAVTDDKLKLLRLKRALSWLKLNAPGYTRQSY